MARFRPQLIPIERPPCGRLALVLGLSCLWLTTAAQEPAAPAALPEEAAPADEAPAVEDAQAEIPSETHLARLETQILFLDFIEERRFAEALPFAETMAELTEAEFGSPSIELATALSNLAFVQRSLKQFDDSNAAFLDAIEMYRDIEGPFTSSTIAPLVSMGANYYDAGDYLQALSIFEEARTVNRRVFGLLNPDQVDIVYHISATLANMRQYEEAHLQQQDALRLMERVHGSDSLEILPYIYRYADWLVSAFQFDTGRNRYLRAMDIIRELEGPDSPRLVTPLREIGNSFRVQKLAEGRGIGALKQALEIAEMQPEPDALELARILRDIGDWYTAFSRVGPSGEEYLRAWELLGSVENGDSLRTEWFDDRDGDYVLREYPSSRGVIDADEPDAVEGFVRIVFDIDIDGKPLNVHVLESDPPGFKDSSMQRAISRSRFRPRVVDGELAYASGLVRHFSFHYRSDE